MSSFMNVMKNLVVRRIIINLIASRNRLNLEINVSSSLTARNQIVAKIIVHIITRNIQVRLHIKVSELMIVMRCLMVTYRCIFLFLQITK